MQYRIVEERNTNGEVFNYSIQVKMAFIWLPVGNARTIEYARETVSNLNGTKTVVAA